MRFISKYKTLTAATFGIVFIVSLVTSSASALNNNRVLDNSVMDNYGSMNAAQIDALLNARNSCISPNSGFSAIDPVGYNSSQGFLYGGNVSAGTIIFHAAQAYQINPQVLLTTLQKEQSLVTSTSCSTNTISKALGYACPDSGGSYSYTGVNLYTRSGTTFTSVSGICVNSAAKAGFTQQLIRAAWMLKFSEQRAQGNIGWAVVQGSWDNSDDLTSTYSGYMTEGCFKRSKYESSCTNYDGYTTIDGVAVHIDTGATAALYRYTPHFHGNQNFVTIFEQVLGFGSTTSDQAAFSGQSDYPSLLPGQSSGVFIRYRNNSGINWYDDVTANAASAHPVHLSTSNPINRSSTFGSTWPGSARAAVTFAKVYEADGSTLSSNQHVALPGQVVEFSFTLTVPANASPGTYKEFFQPILEGASNYDMGGLAWLGVNIQKPTYTATFVGQSPYPTFIKGQSASSYFRYQNTGNMNWYDDSSAGSAGANPVHLATSEPTNRPSAFGALWPSSSRAGSYFSKVYESNGTSLAANQHVVLPGQIVEFDFTFKLSYDITAGRYREFFQPVLEGASNWQMGGEAWLDVTVQNPTYVATYAGQSNYPAVQRGNSASAFYKFQNTGNMNWYDDSSAGSAGANPVHLATSNPINRSSVFSANWPSNNRAGSYFSKVYESNGTSLAANQHVVLPGQIVEFDFTISTSGSTALGFTREYFQPVLEGGANWYMGGEVWLGVNVTN